MTRKLKTFSLDEETWALLPDLAKVDGLNLSAEVRKLIQRLHEKHYPTRPYLNQIDKMYP